MLGTELMIVAALFVATSNYCMRKSIDSGGSTKAFLMIQFFLVFLIAVLLNPVRSGNYQWSSSMALFGIAGGIVLVFMMAFLGKALETGPPGLTFAALNASTVMPSIVMVCFFGSTFGYLYTVWHGLGSIIVLLGLFWAGWQTRGGAERKANWVSFVTAAFFLHVIFLVFLSWRALFINFPDANGLLLSFDTEDVKSQWFMPMAFCAAFVIQSFIFSKEKRKPYKGEVVYGIFGGIANGIGTFFMIWSTEVATSFEHAMIYPLFAITIIVICNLWGQWLYKEKVNWKANILCMLGIVIGTIDWKVLLKL